MSSLSWFNGNYPTSSSSASASDVDQSNGVALNSQQHIWVLFFHHHLGIILVIIPPLTNHHQCPIRVVIVLIEVIGWSLHLQVILLRHVDPNYLINSCLSHKKSTFKPNISYGQELILMSCECPASTPN